MRSLTAILILIICANSSIGMPYADTLSNKEIQLLETAVMKSTYGAAYYADSFTRIKDTVNASVWFEKIDPYYIMYGWGEPENLNKVFARFALTEETKALYRDKYQAVLDTKKSDVYKMFKKMKDEDQSIRKRRERCGDVKACAMLRTEMKTLDSTHFEYLYEYVQNHGWPAIEDGALNASIIAIHDGARADYYIPVIKQAIIDGKLPLDPLRLMLAKKSDVESYEDLRQKLDTAVKFTFKMNTLFSYQLPSNIEHIKKVINEHCPVELVLVFEQEANSNNFLKWTDRPEARNIMNKLAKELQPECAKHLSENYHIYCLPTERKWDRIILHVIPKPKDHE